MRTLGGSTWSRGGARRRSARSAITGVQAWVAELSKDKSASRVITIYSVLASILDDAVRDRMLAANPARGVNLPRRTRRPNVYLTAEQLHRLASESGHYGSLILLLGGRGLALGRGGRAAGAATWTSCGAASSYMRTRWRSAAAPTWAHSSPGTVPHGGVTGVRGRRAGGHVRGQGARRSDLARARRRVPPRRRRTSHGWPVRSNGARRPTRLSRG